MNKVVKELIKENNILEKYQNFAEIFMSTEKLKFF